MSMVLFISLCFFFFVLINVENVFSFFSCRVLERFYALGSVFFMMVVYNSLLPRGSFWNLICVVVVWVFLYSLFRRFKGYSKTWNIGFTTPFNMGVIMSFFITVLETLSDFVRTFVIIIRFIINLGVGHLLIRLSPFFLFLEVFIVLLQRWVMYMLMERFATH